MFEPSQLTIASLPSVAFQDRKALPNCQGIYFAVADNQVLYIGKSRNIANRWVSHHKARALAAWSDISISWLCVDGSTNLLTNIERACIEYFCPSLNDRSVRFVTDAVVYSSWFRLKIRQVAETRGFKTPGALARESRVSYATIHRLWNEPDKDENLTVGVLYRLARTLKVSTDDLMEGNSPGNRTPAGMSG